MVAAPLRCRIQGERIRSLEASASWFNSLRERILSREREGKTIGFREKSEKFKRKNGKSWHGECSSVSRR